MRNRRRTYCKHGVKYSGISVTKLRDRVENVQSYEELRYYGQSIDYIDLKDSVCAATITVRYTANGSSGYIYKKFLCVSTNFFSNSMWDYEIEIPKDITWTYSSYSHYLDLSEPLIPIIIDSDTILLYGSQISTWIDSEDPGIYGSIYGDDITDPWNSHMLWSDYIIVKVSNGRKGIRGKGIYSLEVYLGKYNNKHLSYYGSTLVVRNLDWTEQGTYGLPFTPYLSSGGFDTGNSFAWQYSPNIICGTNGKYLLRDGSEGFYISSDLTNWTSISILTDYLWDFNNMFTVNNTFYINSSNYNNGNYLYCSTNGINWSSQTFTGLPNTVYLCYMHLQSNVNNNVYFDLNVSATDQIYQFNGSSYSSPIYYPLFYYNGNYIVDTADGVSWGGHWKVNNLNSSSYLNTVDLDCRTALSNTYYEYVTISKSIEFIMSYDDTVVLINNTGESFVSNNSGNSFTTYTFPFTGYTWNQAILSQVGGQSYWTNNNLYLSATLNSNWVSSTNRSTGWSEQPLGITLRGTALIYPSRIYTTEGLYWDSYENTNTKAFADNGNIIVKITSPGYLEYSTSSVLWTRCAIPYTGYIYSVCYNGSNNTFYAYGNKLYKSYDGINWIEIESSIPSRITAIYSRFPKLYTLGNIIIIPYTSGIEYTMDEGKTWYEYAFGLVTAIGTILSYTYNYSDLSLVFLTETGVISVKGIK